MPVREEITLGMPVRDALVILAEGNVGAATVLARVASGEAGGDILDIFHLDDMNMRGIQIWVAYKDWAGEDLAVFLQGVRHHDARMIECVNAVGRLGNYAWLAVKHWQEDGERRRIV